MRRARRPKRRGFPNDSRYRRIVDVEASCSQYWSKSLPETSALLPTLTKLDRPSPRAAASDRIARPSAPLCDENATRPDGGIVGENDAFKLMAVFSTPIQLGPTR